MIRASYNDASLWEADLDLALWLKEHWDKVVIAVGGAWVAIQWLAGRKDKAREIKLTEAKGLDEIAREGVNLAFRSMKEEIERLSGEVSGLNIRIDQMQTEFTATLIAKDADLRTAHAENRQLRADYDAMARTLARCAVMMAEAGLEPPIVPKGFQALEIGSSGNIGTMGTSP